MTKYLKLLLLLIALALLAGVPAGVSGQTTHRVEIADSIYTATEGVDSEVEITVEMTPSFGSEVSVGLDLDTECSSGGQAEVVDSTVTFSAGSTSQAVAITICDDSAVEDEIGVRIRLESLATTPATVRVNIAPSLVIITDDPTDRATVGFTLTELEYREEESEGEISVEVTGEVCVDFAVRLETRDITADTRTDYKSIHILVYFNNDCADNSRETQKSVRLSFADDYTVEETETFQVVLERTAGMDPRIAIAPAEATVSIVDSDTATVELDRTLIIAGEDIGEVFVAVEARTPGLYCPVEYSFEVHLSYIPGSADPTADFSLETIPSSITFRQCDRKWGFYIEIVEDAIIEDTEDLTVILTGVTRVSDGVDASDQLEIGNDTTTIEITDRDVAFVGFFDTLYTVTEGESFELPVIVGRDDSCSVPFTFSTELSYTDPDGALSSGPPSPFQIRFPTCDHRQVIQFGTREVAADTLLIFNLTLDQAVDNRILIRPSMASVMITDPGRFHWDRPEDFESLDSGNTSPQGIWSNGGTMWVADNDSDKIYAYNLATKQREQGNDFNALNAGGNNNPSGLWSNDTTMWVADRDDAMVYAYGMTSKERDEGKDFGILDAGNTSPQGIWSDGTTMWISDVEGSDSRIYAYNLDSKERDDPKDITTLVDAGNVRPRGLWADRTTIWVLEHSSSAPENTNLFAYDRTTHQRQEGWDNDNLVPAGNESPRGVWSDGGTLWVSDEDDAKIYAYRDLLKTPQSPPRPLSTSRQIEDVDEVKPASPSRVASHCLSDIVDPDGGEIELGDTIADSWVGGCPSVTRGGRLAKYYTFDLPITTSAEIALDSHLDDYLVLRSGGLSGNIVEQDDDDGPGNNSLISGTLKAGEYTIEATTFYADGVEADFTLSVKAVPRILYDGPVADIAHVDYTPDGPTMTVKLLPTLPMGTLEITIEDPDGFGEGTGPLGGAQADGGSAGTVMLALPKTAWVQYDGITVETRESGSWAAHTQADEQAMLTRHAAGPDLSPVLLGLVRLIGKAEGALQLLQSLAGLSSFATDTSSAEPDESVLETIFRKSHANCVVPGDRAMAGRERGHHGSPHIGPGDPRRHRLPVAGHQLRSQRQSTRPRPGPRPPGHWQRKPGL